MITALLSAVTGLVSGVIPDVVKEVKATREHKRELEFLARQTEAQIRLAEVNAKSANQVAAHELEVAAYDNQAKIAVESLKSTGILWVDAWNGILRPFAVTLIIILFAVMSSFYTYAVLSNVESLEHVPEAVQLLWGSLIGEAIQAVLGFLFGYRSAKK